MHAAWEHVRNIFKSPRTAPAPGHRTTTVVPTFVGGDEDGKIFAEYKGVKVRSDVPYIQAQIETIARAPKFQKWVDSFNRDEIDFREFVVTDVDFFGPVTPNKLGFLKGRGVAFDKMTGEVIPAIAFIRGAAVAVLIVVRVVETNQRYVLMCKQLRFPSGRALIEACAGMIDECTREVVGVVFKEVKEETGFTISEDCLSSLGFVRPSGGGCDEVIHLYSWETEISEAEFREKQMRTFGEEGSHERIKLIFYEFNEFDDIVDTLGDVKAECCWRRYRKGASLNILETPSRKDITHPKEGRVWSHVPHAEKVSVRSVPPVLLPPLVTSQRTNSRGSDMGSTPADCLEEMSIKSFG